MRCRPRVAIAGGAYPFALAGALSVATSWRALRAAQPEVLMPCGFTIPQTQRELAALTEREEWRVLPAVRDERVSVVDGSAYFNRPGPRLIESAEILAALIHPEIFGAPFPPEAVCPLARPAP